MDGAVPAAVATALNALGDAITALEQQQQAGPTQTTAINSVSMAVAINGLHLVRLRLRGANLDLDDHSTAKLDYERSLRAYDKVVKYMVADKKHDNDDDEEDDDHKRKPESTNHSKRRKKQ
jgi:hypothetical protein